MTETDSFHVLVVDGRERCREQLANRLGSQFAVSTADSVDAAAVELPETDCVVVGAPAGGVIDELLDAVTDREVVVLLLASAFSPATIERVSRIDDAEVLFDRRQSLEEPDDRTAVAADDGDGRDSLQEGSAPDDAAAADAEPNEHGGFDEATLESIVERVDARYRASISDLSEVVLSASRSLMGAAVDEVDTKIEWELQSIGDALDADCCSFYRYEDDDLLVRTHEWTRDDGGCGETISADRFPGFDTLASFDPATFPADDGDEDDDAVEVPDDFVGDVDLLSDGSGGDEDWPAYLDDVGFEAFAAVPVVIDWSLYGVLAVGCREERSWSDDLCRQLRTLGEHVGYTLQRRRRRTELEEQNERLERFASVISHDLQNPISVITGYTDLALETGDTEPLTDVMEAAERMERLVNDLLTLAREGSAVGEATTVTLDYLAEQAWTAVDAPDATLVVENDREIEADPSRLQQTFENLFKNAVEHGGEDVTIRVEGTDWGFAVEDDGPGIPAEKRDEVFEEGVTGGDGTGLGLAIVRSVVDGHGWSIDVTEGCDGGARFEVETERR